MRVCTPRVSPSSRTEIKVDVVVTIVCDPDWLVYGARPLPTGEGGQSDARSMALSKLLRKSIKQQKKVSPSPQPHSVQPAQSRPLQPARSRALIVLLLLLLLLIIIIMLQKISFGSGRGGVLLLDSF